MPDRDKIIEDLSLRANGAGADEWMTIKCSTARDIVALLTEKEWHPVTDPPKKSEVCLMTCNQWGGEIVRKGYYFSGEKIFEENGKDITEYVTHWMPAPKPPEERSKP